MNNVGSKSQMSGCHFSHVAFKVDVDRCPQTPSRAQALKGCSQKCPEEKLSREAEDNTTHALPIQEE